MKRPRSPSPSAPSEHDVEDGESLDEVPAVDDRALEPELKKQRLTETAATSSAPPSQAQPLASPIHAFNRDAEKWMQRVVLLSHWLLLTDAAGNALPLLQPLSSAIAAPFEALPRIPADIGDVDLFSVRYQHFQLCFKFRPRVEPKFADWDYTAPEHDHGIVVTSLRAQEQDAKRFLSFASGYFSGLIDMLQAQPSSTLVISSILLCLSIRCCIYQKYASFIKAQLENEDVGFGEDDEEEGIANGAEQQQSQTKQLFRQLNAAKFSDIEMMRRIVDEHATIFSDELRRKIRSFCLFKEAFTKDAEGNSDDALVLLSKSLEYWPRFSAALNNRANIYKERNLHDQCIADYKAAAANNPLEGLYQRNVGHFYESINKDGEKALAAYNISIQLCPEESGTYFRRALLMEDLFHDTEAAYKDYSTAVRLDPLHADAFCNRALVAKVLYGADRALADFHRAIFLQPKKEVCYRNRAFLYLYDLNNEANGMADLDMAISLVPGGNVSALNTKGYYHQSSKQYDKALECFQQASEAQIRFKDKYQKQFQEARNATAESSQTTEQQAKIKKLEERAQRAQARYAAILVDIGRVHTDMEHVDEALDVFTKAYEAGQNGDAAFERAYLLDEKKHEPLKALLDYTRALRCECMSKADAHNNRATILLELGLLADAYFGFTQALRQDSDELYKRNRGKVFNRLDETYMAYREAHSLEDEEDGPGAWVRPYNRRICALSTREQTAAVHGTEDDWDTMFEELALE